MSDVEKTALEIILELPSILKKIENKIDVLDTNLKILNSKLNKIRQSEDLPANQSQKQIAQEAKVIPQDEEPAKSMPIAVPGGVPATEQKQARQVSNKLVLGATKVYSSIKTASGKPVDGMTINIFDEHNDLIRNILTDKDGYWESRLPAGRYSVEMIHPKLKTINKEFQISKDTKSYEVV